MATVRRKPVQREKTEQAHVVKLYRSIGAAVYIMGTRRRAGDFQGTMQTPGIPDLMLFLPPVPGKTMEPALLFHEVKAARGRLSAEQKAFRDACRAAGVFHVVGGLDAAIEFLVRTGRARTESFPHYRRPEIPDVVSNGTRQ